MPASNEWNEICYKARYPDIRTGSIFAGTDGVWYYQSNLVKGHVKQTKKLSDNAYWHWENFGMPEGRVSGCDLPGTNYSNEFNASAYLSRYPDVRLSSQWHADPLGHYQKYGITEGRHPGFEILDSNSQQGMSSPGTTTTIADDPNKNITPGDGSIIQNPNDPLAGDLTDTTITTTPASEDIGTWIAANPLIVAGGAALLLLIISKHKKKIRA